MQDIGKKNQRKSKFSVIVNTSQATEKGGQQQVKLSTKHTGREQVKGVAPNQPSCQGTSLMTPEGPCWRDSL